MHDRYADCRKNGYFDAQGWVADYLFNDPDFVCDLGGDRIGDYISEAGGPFWGDPSYNETFNAVCDALAKNMTWAAAAILKMKHDV